MSLPFPPGTLRIGADVGGTFTDVVVIDAHGKLSRQKIPSTPPDFETAVLVAMENLLSAGQQHEYQVTAVARGLR